MRCTAELLDKRSPIQGPGADSEEKHEPVSGVDIAVAVSLKVLDLDGRLEKRTWPMATVVFDFDPSRTLQNRTSYKLAH